jgi:hypothetical protein
MLVLYRTLYGVHLPIEVRNSFVKSIFNNNKLKERKDARSDAVLKKMNGDGKSNLQIF